MTMGWIEKSWGSEKILLTYSSTPSDKCQPISENSAQSPGVVTTSTKVAEPATALHWYHKNPFGDWASTCTNKDFLPEIFIAVNFLPVQNSMNTHSLVMNVSIKEHYHHCTTLDAWEVWASWQRFSKKATGKNNRPSSFEYSPTSFLVLWVFSRKFLAFFDKSLVRSLHILTRISVCKWD